MPLVRLSISVLRVVLKKKGLDPRRDVQIVEINFPNMGAAIREKRIDCGVLVIPFLAVESRKGDLRTLFTGGDAFGPSSVIFQVARTEFLKQNRRRRARVPRRLCCRAQLVL